MGELPAGGDAAGWEVEYLGRPGRYCGLEGSAAAYNACIMEHLDELSSGVLGQTSGKDRERLPIVSFAAVDHTASSVDAPQTSFDVPH